MAQIDDLAQADLGYFFRKASIDTTLASPAGSAGFSARWPDFAGAGPDGGFADAVFAGAGASDSCISAVAAGSGARGSSLKPNGTDGSVKPVIESKGTINRSGLREKLRFDFERVLGDHEVPELVLEDDRHLVGKAALDRGRNDDSWRLGLERDLEVMVANEPRARGVGEHLAHDGAQRVLHQEVVADEVGRHEE